MNKITKVRIYYTVLVLGAIVSAIANYWGIFTMFVRSIPWSIPIIYSEEMSRLEKRNKKK